MFFRGILSRPSRGGITGVGIICWLVAACFAFAGDADFDASDISIVAHRGAMIERPENTMAAFRRAVEVGADIVEVDVHISRDGRPFILHDSTLERTTDGSGPAAELTFDQLRALDAGSWFDERYHHERIPSLIEVLHWAYGRTVILLDLKDSGPRFAEAVAEDVREAGMAEHVVVGVRSPEQAERFRELLPESPQLAFMPGRGDIEAFADAGVDVIRLWLGWLEEDPDLKREVRDAGRKLMVNGTVGELDEARALISHQPDWILIDDPAQLKRSLERLRADGSP